MRAITKKSRACWKMNEEPQFEVGNLVTGRHPPGRGHILALVLKVSSCKDMLMLRFLTGPNAVPGVPLIQVAENYTKVESMYNE